MSEYLIFRLYMIRHASGTTALAYIAKTCDNGTHMNNDDKNNDRHTVHWKVKYAAVAIT